MSKRYTVTLDAYIYARNDREAMFKSAKLAEHLQTLEDNFASVVSLDESPGCSLASRNVHTGNIVVFENKILTT